MNRRMPNGTSGGVEAGDRQRSPAIRVRRAWRVAPRGASNWKAKADQEVTWR